RGFRPNGDILFELQAEHRGFARRNALASLPGLTAQSRIHHWPSRLTRRFLSQSPRAICAALTMQRSLGGRPQRSDRSQSPQVKWGRRRSAATALAKPAKMSWIALLMAVLLAAPFIGHVRSGCLDKDQFGARPSP